MVILLLRARYSKSCDSSLYNGPIRCEFQSQFCEDGFIVSSKAQNSQLTASICYSGPWRCATPDPCKHHLLAEVLFRVLRSLLERGMRSSNITSDLPQFHANDHGLHRWSFLLWIRCNRIYMCFCFFSFLVSVTVTRSSLPAMFLCFFCN